MHNRRPRSSIAQRSLLQDGSKDESKGGDYGWSEDPGGGLANLEGSWPGEEEGRAEEHSKVRDQGVWDGMQSKESTLFSRASSKRWRELQPFQLGVLRAKRWEVAFISEITARWCLLCVQTSKTKRVDTRRGESITSRLGKMESGKNEFSLPEIKLNHHLAST